jgi:hypothetical protein
MDKKYLDKIVRYLVEDTSYMIPKDGSFPFGDLISISFPFAQISYNYVIEEIKDWIESGWYMDDNVLEFLNNTYGLDKTESSYVMDNYIKNLCRKILNDFKSNPINESENKMISTVERVLDIEYPNLSDSSIDWAEFNCGMGICCDPYAIGFVLPDEEYQYNDYLFKLVDGKNYNIMGDYPIEIYEELPEPCYNRPDITNPEFDVIIIHHEMMETLNNYFNKTKIWESELVTVLNRKFGFNATKFGGFGWW